MFFYYYRVCYRCREYCFPNACPLFFCCIGTLLGIMFRLWSIIFRSIPVIFTGYHANTLDNRVRSATSWAFVSVERSALIFIACSSWPLCITCFSNGWFALDFLGAMTRSDATRIWWYVWLHGVLATIAIDPDHMLNLTMPWILDGTACSSKSVRRPNNI